MGDAIDELAWECGQGWKSIIDPLIELCKARDVQITQIKEKFGTLRFYVGAAPDDVYDAIDEAEKQSAVTCEVCGATGKLRTDRSWLRTLCDEHAVKR